MAAGHVSPIWPVNELSGQSTLPKPTLLLVYVSYLILSVPGRKDTIAKALTQPVISALLETGNIACVEPRSTCALIPQHGRNSAPLPWGHLSPSPPGPFFLCLFWKSCGSSCGTKPWEQELNRSAFEREHRP